MTERRWCTRPDPFDGVWEGNPAPAHLQARERQLSGLEEKSPGRFSASQLRTATPITGLAGTQRSGSGGLLPPGASTWPGGAARLHPLQLPGSNHRRPALPPPAVPAGVEPFRLALRRGGCRRDLCGPEAGTPERALGNWAARPRSCSDNSSALTHEIKRSRGRALNDNYAELLEHYGIEATLINSGESHENGVAEQAHYRLKDALDQALMLRGSRDFDSAESYTGFVRKVVERRNRLVQGKLEQERPRLQCLPPAPVPEYVNHQARVRKWAPSRQPDGPTPYPLASSGRGADTPVRRAPGSVLQGPLGGTHGAGAR